ncbi:MAG: hypothetical protein O3A81_03385 [bacterium]|nr:hypothetical protein [bacterium]
MRKRSVTVVGLFVFLGVAHPIVNAATYYENVHYIRSSVNPLRTRTASARYSPAPSQRCLYYNAQGICMIEQYIDPSNFLYIPTYSRNDLYNESQYSNRDEDEDDDEDLYNYEYFEEDDDDWNAIDDDDNDDEDYDDDVDFDELFDDDDSDDDDSSSDDDDEDSNDDD